MHPLFMSELVDQRQCDLFEEAGGGCAKAPRRPAAPKGRLRQALAKRRAAAASCTDC